MKSRIFKLSLFALLAAAGLLLSGCGGNSNPSQGVVIIEPEPDPPLEPTEFPLQISQNGRFLVAQDGQPFFIHGDSPQALIVNLSESDADFYLGRRAAQGFNAVWINLIADEETGGREDASTFDGIVPFTTPRDLTTPNEAYFARADAVIQLAAKHRQLVILNPIETEGWLDVLQENGVDSAREYGRFLGNRYVGFDNIIWMHGNNFQTCQDPNDAALVQAVALGIQEFDNRHLHTSELAFYASGSLDDPSWRPIIGLNGSFTYYITYVQVLKDYNLEDFIPTFLIEANYEREAQGNIPGNIRRQAYWALLSGAAGHMYGHRSTWQFLPDWRNAINSVGARHMEIVKDLFTSVAWFDLVPDQQHEVITGGLGTFAQEDSLVLGENDYLTAAATEDGTLAIAYLPTVRTITVNMGAFAGPANLRWYDPTNGNFTGILNSAPNAGDLVLTPPGLNSEGTEDWVLLIETN